MSIENAVGTPPTATPGSTRAFVTFILVYAAVAPFVFFLLFLVRGGWLAISVALTAFPSSLIWLAFASVPQGAILGFLVGLLPERWPWWALGSAGFLLGAAITIADALLFGLALIGAPSSPANLAAMGLIGGLASFLVALVLWYAFRRKGAATG
mgnify:CR=1 FL=1